MDDRTREYLRGRFGDYYRSVDPSPPPAANQREWGHIPWTPGAGTTMVRHRSLLDVGDLKTFLSGDAPRHVYFSAARYDDPAAGTMANKGWRSADLIFDLDADHLPGIDPDETSYADMLAACKDALYRLLDFLETDFAFEKLRVVFSGGRGYHVHVRDPSVRGLDSDARREIVDYVRGIDVDPDALVTKRPGETGALRETLRSDGGWGRRVHEDLMAFARDLRDADEDAALDRLQSYEGIGEARADQALSAFENNLDAIEAGNLEVGTLKTLVRRFARGVIEDQAAPIDEPVTTDLRRLIRLPGSLHGGTGLVVAPISRDDLDDFKPLRDAVPDRFRGREIRIVADEPATVRLGGETHKIRPGATLVPEHVGVLLMARGDAAKGKE